MLEAVPRYRLASPAHSPYGASNSAVSQPSTQRPRSRDISFISARSPTSPRSWRPSPSRQTTPADHGPRPRSRSMNARLARSGGREAARARPPGRCARARLRGARATRVVAAGPAQAARTSPHVGGSCNFVPSTRGHDMRGRSSPRARVHGETRSAVRRTRAAASARRSAGAVGACPESARRLADQRIAREAPQELGVIGVDRRRRNAAARDLPRSWRTGRRARPRADVSEPTSTRSPTRSVVVNVPSRSRRVASLACLRDWASENGPAGRTTRSNVNGRLKRSRRSHRDRRRGGGSARPPPTGPAPGGARPTAVRPFRRRSSCRGR